MRGVTVLQSRLGVELCGDVVAEFAMIGTPSLVRSRLIFSNMYSFSRKCRRLARRGGVGTAVGASDRLRTGASV